MYEQAGWDDTYDLRSGRKALAKNDPRRPPAHITGTRRAPDVTATRPHARHGLTSFTASHQPKEHNSLIWPWVDVRADIEAINAGEGIYDPATRRVWINGRLYGMHDDGRTYPMEGGGMIPVNRGAYRGLLIIQRYNGINERSKKELVMNDGLTDGDREEARRIWRLRERALGNDDDNDV